jgi:uncharacterized protein
MVSHLSEHAPCGEQCRNGHRMRFVMLDGDAPALAKQPGAGTHHVGNHRQTVDSREDRGRRIM